MIEGPKQFPFESASKNKYLRYIEQSNMLTYFKRFHGKGRQEYEMVSAVKSLLAGKPEKLPVTLAVIQRWSLKVIKKRVEDFLKDIKIRQDFSGWTEKRLDSHMNTFRYREMLGKTAKKQEKEQIPQKKPVKPAQWSSVPRPGSEIFTHLSFGS